MIPMISVVPTIAGMWTRSYRWTLVITVMSIVYMAVAGFISVVIITGLIATDFRAMIARRFIIALPEIMIAVISVITVTHGRSSSGIGRFGRRFVMPAGTTRLTAYSLPA